MSDVYKGVAVLTAIPIFLAAWIYFIAEQGLFWGLALGWVPAAIIAAVACWAWPVAILGAILAALAVLGDTLPQNVLNTLGYALAASVWVWMGYAVVANLIHLTKKSAPPKSGAPLLERLGARLRSYTKPPQSVSQSQPIDVA